MENAKTGTSTPAENGVQTANAAKTVKYKVEITCWWNDQLYHEDDIVELPANVKPFREDYFTKL